jgi:hypothetical protein
VLAALLLATTVSFAQDDPAPDAPEAEAGLSYEGELDWVTAYFFDGYNAGDEGLFLQPSFTVSGEAYANDDWTITPWGNAWANVTDQKYDRMDYWDELDLGVGSDFATSRWTFGAQAIYYTSPADTFDDIVELGASASFDDSEVNKLPFALNPKATFFVEAMDNGGPEGSYLEMGIEPTFAIGQVHGLEIAVPLITALNINDYYFDIDSSGNEDGGQIQFGYVAASVNATYKVNENWYVTGGVQYLIMLADSTEDANDGDDDAWVGMLGVGFSY